MNDNKGCIETNIPCTTCCIVTWMNDNMGCIETHPNPSSGCVRIDKR